MTCPVCSVEFEGNWRHKFCSPRCRNTNNMRVFRRRHPQAAKRANRRYEEKNKEARRAATYAWVDANRDDINARRRARIAADPEASRAAARAYYAANTEKVKASIKAGRQANPEKRNARERAWRQKNLETHRAKARLDAHRRRAAGRVDTDYAAVLLGDPCSYCAGTAEQLDHIDAVTLGGSNHWTNLTGACKSCNSSKNAKTLLTYLIHRQEAARA